MTKAQLPFWAQQLRAERARRPGWSRRFVAMKLTTTARAMRLGSLPELEVLVDYVKQWENGLWRPGWKYQALLATTYGLSPRELFGDAADLNAPPVLLTTTGGTVDLPHFARSEDERMQRRAFVAWLGALAAGTSTLPDSIRQMIITTGDRTDLLPTIRMHDVASLEAANTMFTDWEHSVGGGLSRRAVVGQLSWALDHLEAGVSGTPDALNAWRISTARLAGTAGWTCHDAGRARQARAFLALGYQVSSTAGGPLSETQRGNFLVQLARHAIDLDRPRTGLDLLRHAQAVTDTAPPMTRSQIHAIKARAYGALGEQQAMLRELGMADEEFAHRKADDLTREPWLYWWHQPAQVHFNHGAARQALLRARPDLASEALVTTTVTEFSTSADAWAAGAQRTAASARLRAASTLMVGRDPEQAVQVARRVIPDLAHLRSKRILDDTHDLRSAAAPYRRRSDVDALVAELSAVAS